MKNFNLIIFSVLFISLFGFVLVKPMKQYEYMASFKESKKKSLAQRIEGRAEERANEIRNVVTGKVDPADWYNAYQEIKERASNALSSRGDALQWENQGPDQVGGRTRGFIFDKTQKGKVYCGGVSGGMYYSENLGHNWKPVPKMAEIFEVMSIGCMTQSKDGDIYAGTGEYWGNTPNGTGGSQFYGNGIYKKKVGTEEWVHLTSTIVGKTTNVNQAGDWAQVLDMSCDPDDNDLVYAATNKGLHKSTDGGETWVKFPTNAVPNVAIAQIKVASDGRLYAAWSGKVFRSTDKGSTWTDLIGSKNEYVSNGNQHVRIAVSATNPDIVYACGITNTRGGDLKYVIRSENGGNSWEFIGKSDPTLYPLCSDQGCQGFYDLCLAVHPKDDNKLFLGGSLKMYSWSKQFGWVQMSNWTNPAELGNNLVHADNHEFAFDPFHPDTMVICTDGGPYITYNVLSKFPNPNWKPIYTKFNVTQFYDMAVNKYGELVGGAQDNGSQFVTLRGANANLSLEVSGGDGFDCAISAANDHQTAFTTIYNGQLHRTNDLSTTKKNLAYGCVENPADPGNFLGVDFHTRIGLVEKINVVKDGIDELVKSYLFLFDASGKFTMSDIATDASKPTLWTNWSSPGVGTILDISASKDLDAVYVCGPSGIRRTDALATLPPLEVDPAVAKPCLKVPALAWKTTTGATNIYDLFVDWNDKNHVIAVQMGFGGTTKVFRTIDGTSFQPRQGDLPVMPVYSCAIDPSDRNHAVVGTEFGIWETFNFDATSPTWVESNKEIGRVPVHKLRVNFLRDPECTMLYAGTHGRGFYRAPFPYKSTCNYTKEPRKSTSGVGYINNIQVQFDIYPNPTSDVINVKFDLRNSGSYNLSVYDMSGRNVKKISYKAIAGENHIKTDISGLQNGNYIIRLESGNHVIGGKIFTKH